MNNMQINKTTKRILDFSRILYGLAGLVLLLPATAQAQSTWANSNIGATPTATLDWLTGGTLGVQIGNNIQLGTASSASALTITGGGAGEKQ